MIDLPQYALWGLLLAALGWFIPHLLRVSRESRAKRVAAKKALHLSDDERDILRQCIAVDGFERGRVWIERIDGYGDWIKAGAHHFAADDDPSLQARYLDAFESLFRRGYFRREQRTLFHLTGIGYEKAQNDT